MNDKFLQFIALVKKSGNLLEGYNICEEAFKKKRVYLLIISKDCSQNTKDKFINYCTKSNTPYIEGYSKEDLGSTLGRPELNILGISDHNMSEKILELWNEKNTNQIRG